MNMEGKKLLGGIVIIFMLLGLVFGQTASYAEDTALYVGISEIKESGTGYGINNPDPSLGQSAGKNIWDLVTYTSAASGATKTNPQKNLYCVKGGVGFDNTSARETYGKHYDFRTQQPAIENLSSRNSHNLDNLAITYYKQILVLLDNMYLPRESTTAERTALLKAAGIDYEDEDSFAEEVSEYGNDIKLTDDDIETVQQMAVWHYTNKGEQSTVGPNYSQDSLQLLNIKNSETGNQYVNIMTSQNPKLAIKGEQMQMLYEYLLATAENNKSQYDSATEMKVPITISSEALSITTSGSNYRVGPINITKNTNIPYTLDFVVKNGSGTTIPTTDDSFVDVNGNKIDKNTATKIYIDIPQSSGNNINVDITINYKQTDATLWTVQDNTTNMQPIIEPTKTAKNKQVHLSTNPSNPFDLALRKYITKIDGESLTNTRIPNVDTTKLNNGESTSACYKHRKDPVAIKKDNVITYNLTVYNEGKKAGRATKIVDQLPDGLQLKTTGTVTSTKGNAYSINYDETNNKVTLTTTGTNNISAYDSTTVDSDTIEIECKVTGTPSATTRKVLTNLAWISEEFDAVDNITITNQQGKDRDSEPATITTKTKDELVTNSNGYIGHADNVGKDLSDSTQCFKGQQDDDDFEKLLLIPESFDLKLIKRITEVNGNPVTERIKSINTSKLNKLDNDGNIIATTAEYDLDKDPVPVKKGDIVTYTFRVYNEGTINGYASEITEDIPNGLEFVFVQEGEEASEAERAASDYNMENGWAYTDTTLKYIKTTNLALHPVVNGTPDSLEHSDNLIKAFGENNDGTKTFTAENYKEISVKMKVITDNTEGGIRNEAEISDDSDENGDPIDDRDSDPKVWVKYEDDEDYDKIILSTYDLALRKFAVAVSENSNISSRSDIQNGEWLTSDGTIEGDYTRVPVVNTEGFNERDSSTGTVKTTADYNHTKQPVTVKKNDIVIYALRVYNEGTEDGYALEITDHLPQYLEFVDGEFNRQYGWTADGQTVKTTYLNNTKIKKTTQSDGKTVISWNDVGADKSKELLIMCKVSDTAEEDQKMTNIAEITKYGDENQQELDKDRDSQPNNVDTTTGNSPTYKDDEIASGKTYIPGQQDDDDFEKVVISKKVDLALTKFITAISNDQNIEDGEYLTKDKTSKDAGSATNPYDRQTAVNTNPLKEGEHDAIYTQVKTPLVIGGNSYVLYNIRVYNEGEVDVYAGEVTDYLPEYLTFVEGEFNTQYGWTADGQTVKTTILSSKNGTDKMMKAFDKENDDGAGSGLDYKDLPILCRVNSEAPTGRELINTAEITKYEDKDGNELPKDIDSTPNNKRVKNDKNREEDDDDYEVVLIENVDIALTKFITAISNDDKIENGEYLTKDKNVGSTTNPYDRQTAVNTKPLKEGKHDAIYTQVKDPLNVNRESYVLYNIRVYNEGKVDVYAGEVTDYLPENLEFVDGEFNKQYGWTANGQTVKTTILSSKNGTDKILKAFDSEKDDGAGSGLDYKDLPILCKVSSKTPTAKELVNTAEITKYEDKEGNNLPNDIDSTPENKKNKNDKTREEDDDDYEVIIVEEFDLSLLKFVSQVIVTEDGKTTTTNTGNTGNKDTDIIPKVEINKKKLNSTTVKFLYTIQITNEGDIAGYAKEITDYVPEGLEFKAEDNPNWTVKGDGVIATRALENTLLKPGESAPVTVVFTWINGASNLGLKRNNAEISEDYNDKNIPDRDSTPNNKKDGEDDIDFADVLLSIKTGKAATYILLGGSALLVLAGGIFLIKKYVL